LLLCLSACSDDVPDIQDGLSSLTPLETIESIPSEPTENTPSEPIAFLQDRAKAFEWVKLSADKGNADAALCAGDMVRYGDGVPVDEQMAYTFYLAAHDINPDCFTLERLGDCYADGIGAAIDKQKAFECYLDSAMGGYSAGIYKLSDFTGYADINLTAIYKAASSLNYSGDYWALAYDGLDGYAADDSKLELVKKLLDIWDSGNDPAASYIQKSLKTNKHFPSEFVEALTQAVYTYSYHTFAEEYGLRPNRNNEDATNIRLAPYDTSESEYGYYEGMVERYLEYDGCQFYEYDFDGDGINEIGVPVHSGAGGAFMADGFVIFKKNADGLYEIFAGGPDCSLRDAMRIIRYDGKVYFIVNPFDDTGNAPHNVRAHTIDKNGKGHEMSITCKNYSLQHIITYTNETHSVGFNTLFPEVEQQMRDAVIATKQQGVYSPNSEKKLAYDGDDDWWSNMGGGYWEVVARQDIFFTADINNDGVDEVIHKGRLITQIKYYDDYYWFQIYEDRDFNIGATPIIEPEFSDGYYGLHSSGNIYNLLPVSGDVVQFWTYMYNDVTFCVTLQRYGLLYAMQIYEVGNGKVSLVSKSLYFDEAQGVDIIFS
jgi:hypothetical protein